MPRKCSVAGCLSWSHARGFCDKHYERWRIHGSPHANAKVSAKPSKSFVHDGTGFLCVSNDGQYAKVDAKDFASMNKMVWSIVIDDKGKKFAQTLIPATGLYTTLQSHVLKKTKFDDLRVEFLNGDTLDCRKKNMNVIGTALVNAEKGLLRNNTSGYKGVTLAKNRRKPWVGQIKHKGKQYNAYFLTKKEAAAWYDEKAREFWGSRAFTNLIN